MAYIDRDAALNYQNEVEPCLGRTAHTGEVFSATRDDALVKYLEQIPAADVRPVVRGHWEEDCAGAAVCSVCGEYAFETSTHHLCGWFPNFCPNCGADMRTGAE